MAKETTQKRWDNRVYAQTSATIREILGRYPKDIWNPYTPMYGSVLSQIPSEILGTAGRILEVGMDGTLFQFKDAFRADAQFFGITTFPDHAKEAQEMITESKSFAQVALHDLQNGLPKGWTDMEVVVDIYSASHSGSLGPIKTANLLSPAIRSGGYLVMAPGMGSKAEFVRARANASPEEQVYPTKLIYRRRKASEEDKVDPTPNEGMLFVAGMLRKKADLRLPKNPSNYQIIEKLKYVTDTMGENIITDYDLPTIALCRKIEKEGFTNVHVFKTSRLNQTGIVAQKI